MAEAHPGDQFGLVGPHGELILDTSSARLLNEIRAEIKRLSNLSGVPPVTVSEDGSGRRIAINVTPPIEALLSGAGGPYAFTEQYWTGTAWATLANGRTGSNAYECNAFPGLAGKVVRLRKTLVDDWRFQWVRLGAGAPPTPCGSLCVQAQSFCGNTPINGATISLISKQVASVTITSGGSGYSSAPAVSFGGGTGSGGTATATISGGVVTGVTVTAGGQFSSAPTVVFTGGGGSGVGATATLTAGTTIGTGTTIGQVARIAIAAGGTGYTSTPSVTIAAPPSGTTATATATMNTVGITSVALTAGGSGYTTAPTAAIGGTIHGSGTTLTVQIGPSAVASLSLGSGGTGYTNGTGYALGFSGGSGSGATGTFDVVANAVTNLVRTAGGSGYRTAPTLSFPGAGGSGATGSAGLTPGPVTSLTRGFSGSGYQVGDAPTIVFSGGGGGSGATGTATLGTFTVGAFAMTNNGSGYTATPSVTVSGGGGTGAVGNAQVVSETCIPIFAAGNYTTTGAATGYTSGTSTATANCGTPNNANPATVILTPTTTKTCLQINGCNGTSLLGETITYTQGGSTVASGTLGDGSGSATNFCATIPQGSTVYSSNFPLHAPARFAPFTTTRTPSICGDSVTANPTPASGYVCFNGQASGGICNYPVATTLHLTDGILGTATLTYDATNLWWYGELTYNYPGCTAMQAIYGYSCPAQSGITVGYYLSAGMADGFGGTISPGSVRVVFNAANLSGVSGHTCPTSGAPLGGDSAGTAFGPGVSGITCAPAFSITIPLTYNSVTRGGAESFYQSLWCVDSGTWTNSLTIVE